MKLTDLDSGDDAGGGEEREFVVISDIHVHPWSSFARGSGVNNSRLRQTLNVLRESLEHAQEHDATWLCAGDIVHTTGHVRNTVLNVLTSVLSEFPDVRKLAVWGDHDSRTSGTSKIEKSETIMAALEEAVPNFKVLDEEIEGLVYGAGAQTNRYNLTLGHDDAPIGLFHVMVDGTETPSGHALTSDVRMDDLMNRYKVVIAGDVHHPQARWDEELERLFLVPGSPEHHNFGDKGDHGWYTLTMKKKDGGWAPHDVQMHVTDSPRFITVDDPEEVKDDGNFYRVKGGSVDEDDLPANSKAVGAPPTTVEHRDLVDQGSSREEILRTWMSHEPPNGPEDEYLDVGRRLLEEADYVQLKDARLVHVEADDFGSYERFEYDVEQGVTLVVGDSRDYESNGAGKSTLFDAVYWLLFGKTTKSVSADGVIRDQRAGDGASECEVRAVFEVEGQTLELSRWRDARSIEVNAYLDDEEIKGETNRATQNAVLEFLGLSEDLYRALAYYSQLETLLLGEATDSTRKELVGDLCGLGAYEEAAKAARSRASELQSQIDRAETRAEEVQSQADDLEERQLARGEQSEQWEMEREEAVLEAESRLQELEDQDLSHLEERAESLRERAESLLETWRDRRTPDRDDLAIQLEKEYTEAVEERIAEIESEMLSEVELKKYKSLLDDKSSVEEEITRLREEVDDAQSRLQNLRETVARADTRFEQAKVELEDAQEMEPGSECFKCGQEVSQDHVDKVREEAAEAVEKAEEDLGKAKSARDEVRAEYEAAKDALESAEDRLQTIEDAEAQIDAHARLVRQLEDQRDRLDELGEQAEDEADRKLEEWLRQDRERLQAWLSRADRYVDRRQAELDADIEKARSRVEQLEEKENPHEEVLDDLASQLDKAESRLEELQDDIIHLNNKHAIFEYWGEGFSKQGLQSLLLDEIAAEFNKIRTEVFPLLTRGVFDVQLSTQSETQSGEKREKTEFIVRQNGQRVTYESLSGGQRRRVDLGIMITLTMANARMRGIPGVLGMLVFDECFGFLDGDGAETVAETLQEVVETIPSIFVITQQTEMQSNFPQVWRVSQSKDGVSHLTT